jgi:hypothetical protein
MYFNCFSAQLRADRPAGAPSALGVSDCGRYALSATREGASPQSCSRR